MAGISSSDFRYGCVPSQAKSDPRRHFQLSPVNELHEKPDSPLTIQGRKIPRKYFKEQRPETADSLYDEVRFHSHHNSSKTRKESPRSKSGEKSPRVLDVSPSVSDATSVCSDDFELAEYDMNNESLGASIEFADVRFPDFNSPVPT